MKKYLSTILILLMAISAGAGIIDDGLAGHMANMSGNDFIKCRIILSEQFDINDFKETMTMSNSTRAERHAFVINSLKEIAARTQAGLLVYLDNERRKGTVKDYTNYWVANIVCAELTGTAIESIAARSDVDIVAFWSEPELIEPVKFEPSVPIVANVESGLEAINAPAMWELGYIGAGRLVANIDTGVDGYHPALMSRWRGNNGAPWQECWFSGDSPNSNYPSDNYGHGTHTMGTLTGLSENTGDTIGVAFGAMWIAAKPQGYTTEAFQWLIDPDSDPYTIDDVPDVVSNSWGVGIDTCLEHYWIEIDNCEAAGIVAVFSAGNNGPGEETVENPADRSTSPYNTFSVGALDGNDGNYPIAEWSARGPSSCDHISIKPEVAAPGVDVRSSMPGGGYQSGSGTSQACPHVAGAVALLRQYNPEATPDTIKWALMQSAVDLGVEGEDNAYGHGLVNIRAALDFMPSPDGPYIYISGYEAFDPLDDFPEPGDDVGLVVELFNTGLEALNVYAVLTSDDPYVTVANDSSYWGNIGPNESPDNENDPYLFTIDGDCPAGYDIVFNLDIFAHGYSSSGSISVYVHGPSAYEIADFNFGNCEFTISNFGQYGLCFSDMNHNWPGLGFKTPRLTVNYLYEGALLIGDGLARISNAARDENRVRENDFVPLEIITSQQPGEVADLEYYSSFDDRNADEPLGVTVNQASYGWESYPDNSYIITVYEIGNDGDTDLSGVRVAHYEDWDIPWIGFAQDMVNFDRQRNLGYQYYLSFYRGMMVLNPEGACAFRALRNSTEVDPPHFTLSDKWSYMTAGFSDTAISEQENASMMLTTGPFDIPPGSSVTAAFAILGASSLSGLQELSDAAIAKYGQITDIEDYRKVELPGSFGIEGIYPNPFNSTAKINLTIAESDHIELDIYDLLGRNVCTLVNDNLAAGSYSVIWDGNNDQGEAAASGIYFARLKSSSGKSSVKKLMYLK